MRRRVLVLACLHLAVAAALGGLGAWHGTQSLTPVALVGFTAAFALVGLFPMHVELGRHACAVTLVETVLVLGLFHIGPQGVVLAAALGELIACVAQRKSGLKIAFNTAATIGAVTVATQAFALGGAPDPRSPTTWAVALLAVAAYAVANHASTSAVLMLAEARSFDDVFTASAAAAGLATMVSASIGLAAVVLHDLAPAAPVLLAPLLLTVVISTRRLTAHRAEHLRFERLYVASSRTAGLQEFASVLATLAQEARVLTTGAIGMCCAPDRLGTWHGVLVDDDGSRPASARAVASVRRLVAERGAAEVSIGDVPEALRAELSPVRAAVVAATSPGSAVPAVLAVFREIHGDEHGAARAEVLAAFAGHAALTVSNACLYEEAEEALRHQLDLNRQKDDFVAVVSHELRTPLTSMLGAVATLRRIGERMETQDRFRLLSIAERQGQRLQRLIEDLLLVAAAEHQGAISFDEVDLHALLDELDADLALVAQGRLRIHAAAGTRHVRTDALKLRQLITNLVENAVKYAPGSPVEVDVQARDGHLVLAVCDHGPGIAESDRERVFERFVQLDQSSTRANGGTGLGLYLCRQLARLLGGSLTLGETPGGGSCFTLALFAAVAPGPAAPQPPAEARAVPAVAPASPAPPERETAASC